MRILRLAIAVFIACGLFLGPRAAFADVRDTDTISGIPVTAYANVTDDLPSIDAAYAGICTADGTMLWGRDIRTRTTMASTTKIMTAIVALENRGLDTPMTVTLGAANTDGSTADLQPGQTLPLGDLLYCMMLPSGNDAAVVIAENVAQMQPAFVQMMNDKAAALGMNDTHYADPAGLYDSEEYSIDGDYNYTTVSDYLSLVRYAMQNKDFRTVVGTQSKTIDIGGQSITYTSTNRLFDMMSGTLGIKTGFTDYAGYCLASAASRGGIELYCVVFKDTTEEQRFIDSQTLLEWGFRHYRGIELINTSQKVGDMALTSWIDKSVPVYAANVVTVNLMDLSGPITQEIQLADWDGAILTGQVCGKIIWSQNGEVLASADLVSMQSEPAPGFWDGLGIAWQRFIGMFTGASDHLDTSIDLAQQLVVPPPAQ